MAKEVKEQTLETVLWNCRNDLRGVGSLDKNRDAVISLVFLKFAGDKFNDRRKELSEKYEKKPDLLKILLERPSSYNAENVFYLTEHARWDYIVESASKDDIAVILDTALSEVEKENPSLQNTLQKNLFVTLGAGKEKLKRLIDDINNINNKKFKEEDLIGRVYEYFLRLYAASGTKEDGEFYTPVSVVKLIAELIEPYKGKVYDPCCGSGGMFVQSLKFVDSHKGNRNDVSILGQESVQETWRLCKMNLASRGISYNLGQTNASTFTNDQHKDTKVDFIMANPPFNLSKWWADSLEKDPRWKGYGQNGGYAHPRDANANYAWILHMISKLDENHGIAGFLLSNGALSDNDDYEIRKNIILKDKIEAIIILPRDMFYTTDISVTLWILNMNKNEGTVNGRKVRDRKNEILFMDLRTWDNNISEIVIDKGKKKKKVELSDQQITSIKQIYNNWQSNDTTLYKDVPELCKSVKLKEIQENDYILSPSKYIEFVDHDCEIDYKKEIVKLQTTFSDVLSEDASANSLIAEAFEEIGYGIK